MPVKHFFSPVQTYLHFPRQLPLLKSCVMLFNKFVFAVEPIQLCPTKVFRILAGNVYRYEGLYRSNRQNALQFFFFSFFF